MIALKLVHQHLDDIVPQLLPLVHDIMASVKVEAEKTLFEIFQCRQGKGVMDAILAGMNSDIAKDARVILAKKLRK